MEGSAPCRFLKKNEDCDTDRCCERGSCLALLPSLVNSSCFPNVRRCFTKNMNLALYAIRPINTNEQVN